MININEGKEPEPQNDRVSGSSNCSPVWFAVDPNDMVKTFDNPEAAREYAESALEFERDNAGDGWSEEVTNIMWGLVVESCEETYRRPREDGDVMIGSHIKEIADYDLVPCGDARLLVPEHTDVATENTAKKIVRRLHLAGLVKAGSISQARGMVIQALLEDAENAVAEWQSITGFTRASDCRHMIELQIKEIDELTTAMTKQQGELQAYRILDAAGRVSREQPKPAFWPWD